MNTGDFYKIMPSLGPMRKNMLRKGRRWNRRRSDTSLTNGDDGESTSSLSTFDDGGFQGSLSLVSPSRTLEQELQDPSCWIAIPDGENNLQSSSSILTTNYEDGEKERSDNHEEARSLVLYEEPSSLPEGIDLWVGSLQSLAKSREMALFLHSTRFVVVKAGGHVVDFAVLPFTIPMKIACSTKDMIGMACNKTVDGVCATTHAFGGACQVVVHNVASTSEQVGGFCEDTLKNIVVFHEDHKEKIYNPSAAAQTCASILGPPCVGVAEKLKGVLLDFVVAPVLGFSGSPDHQERKKQLSDTAYLDRLKLPGYDEATPKKNVDKTVKGGKTSKLCLADTSKYLLAVRDLGIQKPVQPQDEEETGEASSHVVCVDLHSVFEDAEAQRLLVGVVLDRIVERGMAWVNSNPHVADGADVMEKNINVEWRAEGSTERLLKRAEPIEKDLLTWSGDLKGDIRHERAYPMFLARGIVPLSPFDFLQLMWDSSRTREYNCFCMGRQEVVENIYSRDTVMDEGRSPIFGAKVVKSETKVPFTNLSVKLTTLMHARPIAGDESLGYIIVSRSTSCGTAGNHVMGDAASLESSSNEIVWGVNVLRAVPGEPDKTDLCSLSQVATKVPNFLGKRIALMGVEDFVKNVREVGRSRNSKKAALNQL